MARKKTERNKLIISMLKDFNQAEVARAFGVTRERVRQIVEEHNKASVDKVEVNRKASGYRLIASVCDGFLGKIPDSHIAKNLGVSQTHVMLLRMKKGIATAWANRDDHCPECETKEYARGFCKSCYARDLRRRNNASVQTSNL